MKSIFKKISRALQVILMAPVKLPTKIAGVLKYVALGLGIVESVLEGEDNSDQDQQIDKVKLEEKSAANDVGKETLHEDQ